MMCRRFRRLRKEKLHSIGSFRTLMLQDATFIFVFAPSTPPFIMRGPVQSALT